MQIEFDDLVEDDKYLVDLGSGVWLMDDHRWALKVWETERAHDTYTLIHADFHWDAVYDFYDDAEQEAHLLAATTAQLVDLIEGGQRICYDSFITPAVMRGLVSAVHFFCVQDDGDPAIDQELLDRACARQVLHTSAASLAGAAIDGPLIFDLCLDLFNRSDDWIDGDLWSDQEIIEFLNAQRHWIERAEVVTVSLSFNYSGTPEDTIHLARLVVPLIQSFRGA